MVALTHFPNDRPRPLPTTASGKEIASILFQHEKSSRPAVISPEQSRTLSYAELSLVAKNLAMDLQQHGLRRGDRVAILLPTSIEFAAAFFGASTAGAVIVPMDIFTKRANLFSVLEIVRPSVLITTSSLFRKIGLEDRPLTVCLLDLLNSSSTKFLAPNSANTTSQTVSADAQSGPVSKETGPARDREDALILLSSGSMGVPKAVRLSHRAVLANVAMHLESLEMSETICGLQVLPLNYSYGLIACFLSTLHSGGTAVLLPNPQPAFVTPALKEYDINLIMGTPAIFQYVLERAPSDFDFRTSPVRYVTLGGDRCRPYALKLINDRLPSARIYITYGLTEAGPRVSTLPHRFVKEFPDSVGFPLRGVEVSILDNRGRMLAPGEAGEIVVKTPSLMNGYYGDPERTQRVIRAGRCHTGDVGFVDNRGFLYYLGRKDRQFKLGGRLVNPSAIEQCVAAHPAVQDVTVRKSDNGHAEWLCAEVKTRQHPSQALLDELKKICRRRMPAHLIPGEFRFDAEDNYYHKGKLFRPGGDEISAQVPAMHAGSPEPGLNHPWMQMGNKPR